MKGQKGRGKRMSHIAFYACCIMEWDRKCYYAATELDKLVILLIFIHVFLNYWIFPFKFKKFQSQSHETDTDCEMQGKNMKFRLFVI